MKKTFLLLTILLSMAISADAQPKEEDQSLISEHVSILNSGISRIRDRLNRISVYDAKRKEFTEVSIDPLKNYSFNTKMIRIEGRPKRTAENLKEAKKWCLSIIDSVRARFGAPSVNTANINKYNVIMSQTLEELFSNSVYANRKDSEELIKKLPNIIEIRSEVPFNNRENTQGGIKCKNKLANRNIYYSENVHSPGTQNSKKQELHQPNTQFKRITGKEDMKKTRKVMTF